MMSELGRETVSAYAAAKGALKMLTKNIASEYGEYNIQCNGMGPGYIATAQTAPLREVQPDGSRHPFDQFITAKTPAGRWGDPGRYGRPLRLPGLPRLRLRERSDLVRRRRHPRLHRPSAQVNQTMKESHDGCPIVAFSSIGVARLELAASCSQSRRATNCATPRR